MVISHGSKRHQNNDKAAQDISHNFYPIPYFVNGTFYQFCLTQHTQVPLNCSLTPQLSDDILVNVG
jgi:hypothetical protein